MIDLRNAIVAASPPPPGRVRPVYHEQLAELRGRDVSGVYVIMDRRTRRVLYVGESHSGRLYDTITRHFRAWDIDERNDAKGRRAGGVTYDRLAVRLAWKITTPDRAPIEQFVAIDELQPRDNINVGSSLYDPDDFGDLPV